MDALSTWVSRFFAENAAAIAANWSEVLAFSRDLVAHAAAHVAPGGDDPWLDASEVNDHGALRREVGGVLRAVSEVTASALGGAPLTSSARNPFASFGRGSPTIPDAY